MTAASSATAAEPLDNLVIYGDTFMLSLKEPPGWTADSTGQASERVNLVLYRNTRGDGPARPSIRILVTDKTDEKTEDDLGYDMETYRKKFPGVRFKDIDVKHPEYRTFPKLFYVEGSFYEYVTYLNPGKRFRYLITISMNLQKAGAGSEDLQAYAALVASIKAVK
jgi:hypothetical protein